MGRKRCGTCDLESSIDYLAQRHKWARNRSTTRSAGATKYVDIVYIILGSHNLTIEQIRAQHDQLNQCYSLSNSDAERVPQSGKYNFYNVRGNANIQFLPLDSSTITFTSGHVIQLAAPSPALNADEPVTDILARYKPYAGAVNVFINDLQNDLLGQADTTTETVVVTTDSVGGPEALGNSTDGFNQGKTLVHEVGHLLQMPHPWGDVNNGCLLNLFADMPATRNPNSAAELQEQKDGSWQGIGCNRWLDCNAVTTDYGCTGDFDCGSGPYEMFMNFMDYVPDKHMVMFSADQVSTMNDYLEDADSKLTIQDTADRGIIDRYTINVDTEVEEEKQTAIGEAEGSTETQSTPIVNGEETGLAWYIWVSIGVVSLVVILLLVWWLRRN